MSYRQFLESIERDRQDHQALSYDIALFRKLDADDRKLAEQHLHDLIRQGDIKAIETAGLLELASADPVLSSYRTQGPSWVRATAARALWRIRKDASSLEAVEAFLTVGDGPTRAFSAYDLANAGDRSALPILISLLFDNDVIVRYHAISGVIRLLGLEELKSPKQSPLGRIDIALSSSLPTLWQAAAREAKDIAQAILGGIAPDALGLAYLPSPDTELVPVFWAQVRDEEQPFDISVIQRMSAHDRAWAELILTMRLVYADQRCPQALYDLGKEGLKAHLEAARLLHNPLERPAFIAACDEVIDLPIGL